MLTIMTALALVAADAGSSTGDGTIHPCPASWEVGSEDGWEIGSACRDKDGYTWAISDHSDPAGTDGYTW